ncbi:MAG: sensor histidine kinase [Lachnospiraceae bacterium]|nr:sensor histidine kinase [Lachnospiraceae bacterium]
MSIEDFPAVFLNLLSLIPVGIFFYIPMRGRMKRSIPKNALMVFLPQLLLIVLASFVAIRFDLEPNTVRISLFIVFFPIYYKSLDVDMSRAISVYIYIHSMVIIMYNFANAWDAFYYPELGAGYFTMSNSLIQLFLVSAFIALVAYPLKRFGRVLVERLTNPTVWVSAATVPGIILLFNAALRLRKYSTLFFNNVLIAYIVLQAVSLMIIILLSVFFYFIVSRIYRETQTQEEIRILKMQERYFRAQQKYMNETSRARHDFKHAIHTLERLASDGDLDEIKSFLNRYTDSMPRTDIVYYCENMAVNALLNYYMDQAKAAKIRFTLEINMPLQLPVPDVDMCAVIGNILENAMLACMEIPYDERFIDLAIRFENKAQLYIVVSNSFSGDVRIEDGRYKTTHGGSGIGLSSVTAVAQACGGTARFSHEGGEFFSDVILPLKGIEGNG